MSLVVFGVVWVCVWALCWFGWAGLRARNAERFWRADVAAAQKSAPGLMYVDDTIRDGRTAAMWRPRCRAPYIASLVAFAAAWAIGGLFS